MERVVFAVVGSQGDVYEVTFERDGARFRALCTCMAGLHGQLCKHRFALLRGEAESIASGNESELPRVGALLAGSTSEDSFRKVAEAEKAYTRAKAALDASKKELARVLQK